MARRTPTPEAPATIWHEAHPGRPDLPLRVCAHPRVKVTAKFAYYDRCCRGTSTLVSPLLRLSHEELASGEWVRAYVWDREIDPPTSWLHRHNQQFSASAWLRAGSPPTPVPRPPTWDDVVREAVKAQREHDRVMREAAHRVGAYADSPTGRRFFPGMAERLGYRPDDTHRDDLTALGLATMPDDAEGLKRAWQKTAKRTHPDAGGDPVQFTRAKAAYERLAQAVVGCGGVATGF